MLAGIAIQCSVFLQVLARILVQELKQLGEIVDVVGSGTEHCLKKALGGQSPGESIPCGQPFPSETGVGYAAWEITRTGEPTKRQTAGARVHRLMNLSTGITLPYRSTW